jgi:EAL domain-containing protein (putative c-di-GMP-specific phosphodiesterase class I)
MNKSGVYSKLKARFMCASGAASSRGVSPSNHMSSIELQNGNAKDSDLARALTHGEIEPYFLPKVDLRNARPLGVEALARWVRPNKGVTAASAFMDQVEEGGYDRSLTERMIDFSTRVAGDWWRSGLGLQLSVNLSLGAVADSGWDLPEFVNGGLAASGLPSKALQFEVTEDGLLTNAARATEVIGQLTDLGTSISIDDFGTGHFSLRQLKQLPIEELKMDRSLVSGLEDEENRAIVRSTIHLAHQMGIAVLAEGVETETAWRQLRSMGCERAQGHLIAKPLPAREVPAWLASWNQRARELTSTRRVGRTSAAAAKRRAATAA